LFIPPSGQIRATCKLGRDTINAAGGMSEPATDFLPPQCKEGLKALFIYPIFSGVVITNCINQNATNGSSEIFVKNGFSANPFECIRPKWSCVSQDILNAMEADKANGGTGRGLQWIPAILQ
jgi:hypothetical protein